MDMKRVLIMIIVVIGMCTAFDKISKRIIEENQPQDTPKEVIDIGIEENLIQESEDNQNDKLDGSSELDELLENNA